MEVRLDPRPGDHVNVRVVASVSLWIPTADLEHDSVTRRAVDKMVPVGVAGGLTTFGINLSRLPPGVWSSQRHWHTHEDEFCMVM